jgi:hypothetical protein
MADSQLETFTTGDRKELIKQGIQLEQLIADVKSIKLDQKESMSLLAGNQEMLQQRIRNLEDYQIVIKQNIKFVVWITSFVSSILSAGIALAAHYLIK